MCDNGIMRRLLLTLPTPAENLALDEALLEWAEENDPQIEFLRLWESPAPLVVVGRSSRLHLEVHESACTECGIPVLRRSSGGAAIVAGPGCLMYAVVLSLDLRPELRDIHQAHSFVLGRLAEGLRACGFPVEQAGTSDLVFADVETGVSPVFQDAGEPPAPRKFSGNSLRVKRTHLLYHGTLLYDFDLSLSPRCLKSPPREPEYRAARSHLDFVANLPTTRSALTGAVMAAWPTMAELVDWPQPRVAELVAERFSQESWNREFA